MDSPCSPPETLRHPTRRLVAVALQAAAPHAGETANQTLAAQATITAAGRGAVAEQILTLAFDKGVKVRQDADLAEILAQMELDTPIPSEAVIAVAEILTKVYEANNRLCNSDQNHSFSCENSQGESILDQGRCPL